MFSLLGDFGVSPGFRRTAEPSRRFLGISKGFCALGLLGWVVLEGREYGRGLGSSLGVGSAPSQTSSPFSVDFHGAGSARVPGHVPEAGAGHGAAPGIRSGAEVPHGRPGEATREQGGKEEALEVSRRSS